MSTYKDHKDAGGVVTHSWAEHTKQRLDWAYPGRDHVAAQAADVARWNRLGLKAVAA